jgi:hypothetical protein
MGRVLEEEVLFRLAYMLEKKVGRLTVERRAVR